MKRLFTIQLIAGYLFVTLFLSQVHNHPLTEPEKDSCPAFIIATVVNSDDVPTGLSQVTGIEFTGVCLPLVRSVLSSQPIYFHTTDRAPPASC